MKTITLKQLRAKGAYEYPLKDFERLFGHEMTVTAALAREYALNFNWDWMAEKLLSAPLLAEYEKDRAQLLEKYKQAHAPLLANYEKARVTLWAEYEKTSATLWEEYKQARALLWEEYVKADAPLWAEYRKVCAMKFAALYLS